MPERGGQSGSQQQGQNNQTDGDASFRQAEIEHDDRLLSKVQTQAASLKRMPISKKRLKQNITVWQLRRALALTTPHR